jgi:hypothetical protein
MPALRLPADVSAAERQRRLRGQGWSPACRTSLRAVPQQSYETHQFPAATYGAPPAAGQLQLPQLRLPERTDPGPLRAAASSCARPGRTAGVLPP